MTINPNRTMTIKKSVFNQTGIVLILLLVTLTCWGQTTVTLYPDIDANVIDKTGLQDNNYPISTVMRGYTWTESSVPVTYRSVMKIDLSSIPAGATITSADLTLFGTNHDPYSGSNACWLERCTQDWTETGVTWNNQPSTTTSGRKSIPQSTSSTEDFTIDITDFVQGWMNGTYANYGMKLKLQTEVKYRKMEFASSDHGTSSKHPKLVVTYTEGEKNHIARYIPNQAWSSTTTLPTTSKEVSRKLKEYRDLQGRPLQAINIEASPTGKDMIRPMVYDAMGRPYKNYLPFATTTINNAEYVDDATNPNNWTTYYGTTEDDYTFSETVFEDSPLGRPTQQGANGSNWAIASGHEIETDYETSVANQVFRWYIDHTSYLPKTTGGAYYPANYLFKTTTTNEDGHMVLEFTDKRGRTILKKVQTASNPSQTSHIGWTNTYYVYDDNDNLIFVLPPKLVDDIHSSVNSNYTVDNNRIQNLAFQYKYDGRQRLVESRAPSSQWIYIVYDDLDRVVMTQDGNQRSAVYSSGKEWVVTKYDAFNRPVISGIYTHGSSIDQAAMAALISTTNFNETYNGGTTNHGYTNSVWPTTGVEVTNVTYYDNYDFLSIEGWDSEGNNYSYQNPGVPYEATYFPSIKGQVTGSKTKLLSVDKYLNTVVYFDNRYRPIQVTTENHKGTSDRVSNHYDFNGNLLDTETIHQKAYDLVWTDLVNLTATATDLEKTTGGSSWNGGAASENILPAGQDGWVEMIANQTNKYRMFGLSSDNSNASWNTIDYALYLRGNATAQVRQSGSGSLSDINYQIGDVFRIERINGTIYYKQNGVTFYTSTVTSTTQLLADVALNTTNSKIHSAYASFGIPNEEDLPVITSEHSYTYDHQGRQLEVRHQTDSQTEVLLSENSYNELGELEEKDLHSLDNGATRLQSVDYRYNIRGWLTSINNAGLINNSLNNDTDDYFGMELGYNVSLPGMSAIQVHDGNISSVKFSVKNSAQGTYEAGYKYVYDRRNQLTTADFRSKATGSWTEVPQYDVTGISYDLNGNIQGLTRKNASGTNMDVLSYNYGSGTTYNNKLLYVNDTGSATEGYKNGNTGTDDYSYDANGNLIADLNKGVTDIEYNYLNLPQRVTFDADKYIKYHYDASGTRLRQEIYEDAIATRIVDYIGGAVIENNLIKEIGHGEGRIIPDRNELNEIESYRYEYYLTDHLGNIRVVFGEEEVDEYIATMETDNQTTQDKEEAIFSNMNTRVVSTAANHTNPGNEASRINNTQPIGPAISLKVFPGDQLDMDTWAYYTSSSGYGSQITQTTWINELASSFGGVSGGVGEAGVIYNGINAIGAGLFGGSNGSSVPAAYLNYILFDQDYNYITNGFVSISSGALNSQEHLVQSPITVDQPGYVFVYVSNESNSSNWVYFDDLKVKRTRGEIKQETHFYPYGLAMAGIGKQGSNDFLYQGKEWQEDHNLGIYDFHARQFDAALARFTSVDPAGQFASPFVGMGNNPVIAVDPDGEFSFLATLANFGINLALSGGNIHQAASNALGGIIPGPSFIPANALEGFGNAVLGSLIQGAGNNTSIEHSLMQSIPGAVIQGIEGASIAKNIDEMEESVKRQIKLRQKTMQSGEISVGPIDMLDQFQGVLYENEGDAYDFMWSASSSQGIVTNEVAAFLTNKGVLIQPTAGFQQNGEFARNTPRRSYNNFLPLSRSNGNIYVTFDGRRLRVFGQVHTHPNFQTLGFYEVIEDFNLQNRLGIPVYIIRFDGFYDLNRTFLGTRSEFNNGTKSLFGQ